MPRRVTIKSLPSFLRNVGDMDIHEVGKTVLSLVEEMIVDLRACPRVCPGSRPAIRPENIPMAVKLTASPFMVTVRE